MQGSISYFDLAENDYDFFKIDYEQGRVGNVMCSASQNICVWYLKHVICVTCVNRSIGKILHTQSLLILRRFLEREVKNFKCNWDVVMLANGYYFTTMYPSVDTFFVDKDDVEQCWKAVLEMRRAVYAFLGKERDSVKVLGCSDV